MSLLVNTSEVGGIIDMLNQRSFVFIQQNNRLKTHTVCKLIFIWDPSYIRNNHEKN